MKIMFPEMRLISVTVSNIITEIRHISDNIIFINYTANVSGSRAEALERMLFEKAL